MIENIPTPLVSFAGSGVAVLILVTIHPLHIMGLPPSPSEKELEHHARTAYYNGNYLAALQYLHQILKRKSTVQILTNIGSTLNELQNYSGSLSFYRRALKLNPHDVWALLGIGATLDLLYSGNQGVTYFKDVLQQPANTTVGKLQRALTLTHLHNYTQALGLVDQLPPSVDTLNAKGVILLYQKTIQGPYFT